MSCKLRNPKNLDFRSMSDTTEYTFRSQVRGKDARAAESEHRPPISYPVKIKVFAPPPPFETSSTTSKEDDKQDDDFYPSWDRFLACSPNRTSKASAMARRVAQTVRAANKNDNGLEIHESPAKSYDVAAAQCRAKVRAIVDECRRLNQKYHDRHFDLDVREFDCIHPLGNSDYESDETTSKPSAVKRVEDIFEKPEFNEDRAAADDVMQGSLGDCWLLASIMSIAAKPGLVKRLCVDRDEQAGVYGFVFFRDGAWIPEVIDDRLFLHVSDGEDLFVGKYVEDHDSRRRMESGTINVTCNIDKLRDSLQKGGEALFFARCKGSSDTWLPLLEKAYAKAHGDYGSLSGGRTSEGIEDLTGGVSVMLKLSQILDREKFWEELKQVNETYLFGGSAKHYERNGRVASHAYAVIQVAEYSPSDNIGTRLRLLKLRDPWGKHQGDGPWTHKFTEWTSDLVDKLEYNFKDPGVFWMTYEKFLRHFYAIDKTRLFGSDWRVAQQWTSVNVPPIAEYLDTQFILKLSKSGPVVVLLCQPDPRYFHGLGGRYEYTLHFRIYSISNQTTYLARSMHTTGMSSRSVSADLTLPAGTYNILVKVTASRTLVPASGNAVVKHQWRSEKLLQVGRNLDLAYSKGKRRAKEQDNKAELRALERQKRSRAGAQARSLRVLRKEQAARRKERINKEKDRRVRLDLMKRAGILWSGAQPPPVVAPHQMSPPPPETADAPSSPSAQSGSSPSFAPAAAGLSTAAAGGMEPLSTVGGDDPTVELEDDDFAWDSAIDGSVESEDSESDEDLYADDPWNAICTIGLRVYSQCGDAKIKVVEGEYRPEEDGDDDDEKGEGCGSSNSSTKEVKTSESDKSTDGKVDKDKDGESNEKKPEMKIEKQDGEQEGTEKTREQAREGDTTEKRDQKTVVAQSSHTPHLVAESPPKKEENDKRVGKESSETSLPLCLGDDQEEGGDSVKADAAHAQNESQEEKDKDAGVKDGTTELLLASLPMEIRDECNGAAAVGESHSPVQEKK